MPTTQAQAAVMEQAATRFDQVNGSLQAMLQRLLNELEVLQTAWVGAGGTSFQQVKLAWAQDQQALHQALADTASAIRSAGRRYAGSDRTAADRFVGHPAVQRLPL